MDVKQYWLNVRKIQATLSNPTYLVLVANPAKGIREGLVAVTTPQTAAKCLTKGTHVMATDEQIEVYKTGEDTKRHAAIEKLKPIVPQVQNHITIDETVMDKLFAEKTPKKTKY
jgi:hypothetical protein